MDTKDCPVCGAINEEAATSCACGHRFDDDAAVIVDPTLKPPKVHVRPNGIKNLERAPWLSWGGAGAIVVGAIGNASLLAAIGGIAMATGAALWLIGSIQHALWFTAGVDARLEPKEISNIEA